MQKLRENNCNKSQLYLVGSLLIIIGLSILFLKFYCFYKELRIVREKVNDFYVEQQEIKKMINTDIDLEPASISSDYIAILKIDKINLENGLYPIDSKFNNVDYNIEILSNSTMPDQENGNLVLAGHNGNGNTSYFRYLYKVNVGDYVSVFYNGIEYKYQVINSYKVDKTGKVDIVRNSEKTTLTLITCSGNDKQLVVVCELVDKI